MIKNIQSTIDAQYHEFIVAKKHPCVMANSVFQMHNYHLKVYDDITSDAVVDPILSDIETYIKNYNFNDNNFESLILCFETNKFETELEFETAMWNFLQKLHNSDDVAWDENVSADPDDKDFSFSLKGKAFYVIGMHPKSSRMARQAPYCTLVLNLHGQFERLREMGIYQSVKKRIRSRDEALQGSINPVLQDFGEESESRQYSGRNVDNSWKCPFLQNKLSA